MLALVCLIVFASVSYVAVTFVPKWCDKTVHDVEDKIISYTDHSMSDYDCDMPCECPVTDSDYCI